MALTPVQTARIRFNETGTPVSREFEDIYFSDENGLAEARYVFLDGNDFPGRFARHLRPEITIAESGFGTGLNFLALWQAFSSFRRTMPDATLTRLHFISFEKFPLSADCLALVHARWPELAPWAEALRKQWPVAWPGCHRLLLDDGRVTLDLWFGDINFLISRLDDSYDGQIDAWFLDGFAPAKNPDMWTPTLFSAMARLARPEGTLATFSAAGFVRRGLTEAGFKVAKRKGFGRKREMLIGKKTAPSDPAAHRVPWYARPAARGREAAIIGGGIASAMLALMLLRRDWQVTLYCADAKSAQGASGNRQGALYPLLNGCDPVIDGFFPAAFGFARRLFDNLDLDFDHDWCGVTQLAWNDKSRQKIDRISSMEPPPALAMALTTDGVAQACGLTTGCNGITYPGGGWLCAQQLTRQATALAVRRGMRVHYGRMVTALAPEGDDWLVTFSDATQIRHSAVVIACGAALADFEQTARLPVSPVAGQVSHIPGVPALLPLRQVLCYDGYLTPVNPTDGLHAIGASYRFNSRATSYSERDQQCNRQRLINALPDATWTQAVDVSAGAARSSVRCATRDHLPLVGNVPDYTALVTDYARLHLAVQNAHRVKPAPCYPNLFVLGALGSRGLCSAPLAAELLAAQMSGEPLPLDAPTLFGLHPNRYWVRRLLRGRPV